MRIDNKNNNQLNTLLNEVKEKHDAVKKNLLGKLKEMDSLEEQYKKILGEIKKRYNI
jgi:predicted  nucleic acid-binding Zn-ribbon protein|tara:strand:- start:38219 stop:38389 length:171 start_codon:yes stop_codon:yes gene_type:complete